MAARLIVTGLFGIDESSAALENHSPLMNSDLSKGSALRERVVGPESALTPFSAAPVVFSIRLEVGRGWRRRTGAALFLALAFLCQLVTAQGTTYLDNLSQPHQYYADVTYSKWVASRFVTDGSAQSFSLNSVLFGGVYAATAGGNFQVDIYSTGAGSTVGSLVGALSGASSPDSLGQYTFTATGITLQANTSYWLVTKVTSGLADYRVSYTQDTAASGGWTIPLTNTYSWSTNQGSSWGTYGGYWPYRYKIEATAVPEPSSPVLVLFGASLLSFVWVKRSSRRSG